MIKSPRCEICQNKEYRNKVNFGYIFENKVSYQHVKMCKYCELNRVKKVAEDEYKSPIYVEND